MRVANYEYAEKIGQGAFGTIYKGRNVRTGEKVVIKTELREVEFSSLKHESNILNILYSKHCRSIPPTYWYGVVEPDKRALIMPFYDESLESFVSRGEMKDYYKHIVNIMRSAISILSHIHDKYVVHRDIKPANWMIHNNELVLIDFGLAYFYVDSNGRHIQPATPKKLHIIGTPKYASYNLYCGEEYSRRDDLISMVYIGMFLIYGSQLWSNIPPICMHGEDRCSLLHPLNQWFKTQKELDIVKKYVDDKWHRLSIFATKLYALSFQERPSYKEYIELFQNDINACP
jgi:serine/threonine protein kinase